MVFFTSFLPSYKSHFLSLHHHQPLILSFSPCLSFSQSMGIRSLIGCLSGVTDDEIVGATKTEDPLFVCRDDLNKKPSHTKEGGGFLAPAPAPVLAGLRHGRERSGSKQVTGSTGEVKRVKILLTKQQASLLLANCKVEDGLVKLKLSQLQTIRTTCTTSPLDSRSWNPTLQSISEDF